MANNGQIILIDDDKDECELMEDVFSQLNIPNRIVCFHDGRAAFDYLKKLTEQPFLIFSDINMPGMSGIELRKHINNDEELRSRSIPFIFFTTSAGAPAVKEAYEMSVQGFFEKPHEFGEIKRLVKSVVDYWQTCRHPNNS